MLVHKLQDLVHGKTGRIGLEIACVLLCVAQHRADIVRRNGLTKEAHASLHQVWHLEVVGSIHESQQRPCLYGDAARVCVLQHSLEDVKVKLIHDHGGLSTVVQELCGGVAWLVSL